MERLPAHIGHSFNAGLAIVLWALIARACGVHL